jgi:hypothetical protein
MSPRAYTGGGLPGPGQEHFPEGARETGRALGLTDSITVLVYEDKGDGAGGSQPQWTSRGSVRGRLDPVTSSTRGFKDEIANVLNEETTHIVTLDQDSGVSTSDRLEIDGKRWIITTALDRSDALVDRFGVRGL